MNYNVHDIYSLENPGKTWVKRESNLDGLADTIRRADELMAENDWYAVKAVLWERQKYVNCKDCGPFDEKTAKIRKLPRWDKGVLPMTGNPLKG